MSTDSGTMTARKLALPILILSCLLLVGCHGFWAERQEELKQEGYTQEQADAMIAMEQDKLASGIKDLKNTIIDMIPVPAPKEPVKDITDYWLHLAIAALGGGGLPVVLGKLKRSTEGKLFG